MRPLEPEVIKPEPPKRTGRTVALLLLALVASFALPYIVLGRLGPAGSGEGGELYSTGFEQEPFDWKWNSDYAGAYFDVGRDDAVAHTGSASAHIRSTGATPPEGVFASAYPGRLAADRRGGLRIRYSAFVKSAGLEEWAGLWMRTELQQTVLDFDNMVDRPVLGTTDWKLYSVVLDIPPNADAVYFGVLQQGRGEVWLDDVRLEIVGADVPATGRTIRDAPCNLNFEEKATPCWTFEAGEAHLYTGGVYTATAHSGAASGFLKSSGEGARASADLYQAVYAEGYAGKRISFSAYVKTEGVGGRAGLLATVWGAGNEVVRHDDMASRPITGTTGWQQYEIVTDVPEGSVWFMVGLTLQGSGQAWIDDAQIEVVDEETPVTGGATPTP